MTITYRDKKASPPVYIAGTHTERPWEPQEMERVPDKEEGVPTYEAVIMAEEGSELQFKISHSGGEMADEGASVTSSDSGSTVILVNVPREEAQGSTKKAPPSNLAAHLLSRSAPDSGASTPSFVKTTTEVADSAATLDKEESEPEISDREAGRSGARRLSTTPIPKVANTAAEVADVAKTLDAGMVSA